MAPPRAGWVAAAPPRRPPPARPTQPRWSPVAAKPRAVPGPGGDASRTASARVGLVEVGVPRCECPPERVEQRLRALQVGQIKALGEPRGHGHEQVASLGGFALVAPELGEAGGSPELPGLRRLTRATFDRALKCGTRLVRSSAVRQGCQKLPAQAMQFGLRPTLPVRSTAARASSTYRPRPPPVVRSPGEGPLEKPGRRSHPLGAAFLQSASPRWITAIPPASLALASHGPALDRRRAGGPQIQLVLPGQLQQRRRVRSAAELTSRPKHPPSRCTSAQTRACSYGQPDAPGPIPRLVGGTPDPGSPAATAPRSDGQRRHAKVLAEDKGRRTVPFRIVQRNGLLRCCAGGEQLAWPICRTAHPVRQAQSLRVGVLRVARARVPRPASAAREVGHADELDRPEPIQHGKLLRHVAHGLDRLLRPREGGGGLGRRVAVPGDARLTQHVCRWSSRSLARGSRARSARAQCPGEMADGFRNGRAPDGALPGRCQYSDRPLGQARLGEVMGQQLGLGFDHVRQALLQHLGDPGVQLLAPARSRLRRRRPARARA